MNRFVSILVMLFVFLFGTSGSVLGAYNYSSPEVLSGNFLLWETEASAERPLELADPTKEIGVWAYDEALGVPVYVRQNPWTKFDPLGLSEKRVDPDGFEWKGKGHHKVPAAVARDAGWGEAAKEIFDQATIETPKGHNSTAHGRKHGYSAEVAAEMAEFLDEKGGLGGKSAREQEKLAKEFVKNITYSENKFIRGFNRHVDEGPKAVKKWFKSEGKNIVLKSTGKLPNTRGAKIINGIAATANVGGKTFKGVPIVSGLLAFGGSVASGKSIEDAGIDMSLSVTGADIGVWVSEQGVKLARPSVEKHVKGIQDRLDYLNSDDLYD